MSAALRHPGGVRLLPGLTRSMARSGRSERPEAERGVLARGSVFFAFAPWIVFDVVAGPSTWKLAAVAALICAVVLNVPDLMRGAPKILDVVGIVFFLVISVLGLTLQRHDLIWLETYAQTLASGAIAVVALGSLAFVPFTEQYARVSAPPEVWESPAFRRTNRLLTAMWGLVFAVIAILGLVALHVRTGTDWLNWIVPVALLAVAVRITRWYPQYVRRKTRPPGD
ncbi:hypothetical protein [Streptantibioticus ferralitis]|uniref:Uncharacterized protein n=1 Tax=Streptantibioticus ferralitis TaxID=236510 RepID=A0ABT5YW39_9ACTN|nr:hypothetical protein [Streptantibioticus ferralitis]MDF2255803.1 hypothetical protein [Streptantibioticus ferralitis]